MEAVWVDMVSRVVTPRDTRAGTAYRYKQCTMMDKWVEGTTLYVWGQWILFFVLTPCVDHPISWSFAAT